MNDTKTLSGSAKRTLRDVLRLCLFTHPTSRTEGFHETDVWGGARFCNELVDAGFLADDGHQPTGGNWYQLTETTRTLVQEIEERTDRILDDALAGSLLTPENAVRLVQACVLAADNLGATPSKTGWTQHERTCSRVFQAMIGRKPTAEEQQGMTVSG